MSGIIFATIDDETRVSGSERAHFGIYCNELMCLGLDPVLRETQATGRSPLREAFPSDSYLHKMGGAEFTEAAKIWFGVSHEPLRVGDRLIQSIDVALNTALSIPALSFPLMKLKYAAIKVLNSALVVIFEM